MPCDSCKNRRFRKAVTYLYTLLFKHKLSTTLITILNIKKETYKYSNNDMLDITLQISYTGYPLPIETLSYVNLIIIKFQRISFFI
jgi:hypothetical protein